MQKPMLRESRRRGAVLVVAGLLMVVLAGVAALTLDMGFLYVVKSDLQASADSAALAGASALGIDESTVRQRAYQFAMKNTANGAPVVLDPSDVQLGIWDPVKHTFTPLSGANQRANAVKVTPRLSKDRNTQVNLGFASMLGVNSSDVSASSVAVFGLRDIMLALDFSASMNDDSELGNSHLSKTQVEQMLWEMYQDLGSPTYGAMNFTPVKVSSSSSKQILSTLGLTSVKYPYPSGSWDEYFQYVQTDSAIKNAGYQKCYGYMTLINYWEAVQFKYSQTPDLWKTREQPVTAVKDGVSLLVSYLTVNRMDDRMGLSAYTYTDGEATLEMPLTSDLAQVDSTTRHHQAGHYHEYTNIAAGLKTARTELEQHGRSDATKIIVLLSDGNANWYKNTYDLSRARQAALNEATAAANDKFPIVTISLGADADLDLMQQIADKTGGLHFIVPGGSNVNDYKDQLYSVFSQIAGFKSARLVD